MTEPPAAGAARRFLPRGVVLFALVASAALAVARFDSFQVGAYYDDAHYAVLAEALASGQGMRLISYPEAPPEWAFPPGLPLMLAPLAALFPGRLEMLRLVPLACWLGAIPLVYLLSAGRLPATARTVLTFLVALHPALVQASGTVMSEAPYLFFSLLALVLYAAREDRVEDPGAASPPGIGGQLATALAAVWAQLVRSVGMALLPALVLAPLLRRRWKDAARVAALLALGLVPQFAWSFAQRGDVLSAGYRFHLLSSSPAEKLAQMAANAREYTVILPDLLLPLFGPRLGPVLADAGLGWVPVAVRALLLAGVGAGFLLGLRRPRALEIYAVFYLGAVLAFWNPVLESAQERYLLPLLPFLYLCLLRAGAALAARLPWISSWQRRGWAAAVLSMPFLLLFVLRNVQDVRHPVREAMTDLSAGAGWIAAHAPTGAVVMSKNPVQDYLYTRRHTVPYPGSAEELEPAVAARGVDYVLVAPRLARTREKRLDPFTAGELLPALRARPDRFAEVFRDPAQNAAVFAVRESAKGNGRPGEVPGGRP